MTRAEQYAADMGRRAGERFRLSGLPSPNPFTARPVLAAAWRRAYLGSLNLRRPERRRAGHLDGIAGW